MTGVQKVAPKKGRNKKMKGEGLDSDPQPYNHYNLYFILERELFLQERGVYPRKDRVIDVPSFHRYSDSIHLPSLPSRYASLVLPVDWFVHKTKKRAHVKTHGLVSFREIAAMVANRWKKEDEGIIRYCKTIAEVIKRRAEELRDAVPPTVRETSTTLVPRASFTRKVYNAVEQKQAEESKDFLPRAVQESPAAAQKPTFLQAPPKTFLGAINQGNGELKYPLSSAVEVSLPPFQEPTFLQGLPRKLPGAIDQRTREIECHPAPRAGHGSLTMAQKPTFLQGLSRNISCAINHRTTELEFPPPHVARGIPPAAQKPTYLKVLAKSVADVIQQRLEALEGPLPRAPQEISNAVRKSPIERERSHATDKFLQGMGLDGRQGSFCVFIPGDDVKSMGRSSTISELEMSDNEIISMWCSETGEDA